MEGSAPAEPWVQVFQQPVKPLFNTLSKLDRAKRTPAKYAFHVLILLDGARVWW